MSSSRFNTSKIVLSSNAISIPNPRELFPCGSISIRSTLRLKCAKEADKLIAVVVLPTPPF